MAQNPKNGWFRLIATSTVVSAIVTGALHYKELKSKEEFEIKKEGIQRELVTLERLASNLDLLESRLFALRITSSAVAGKVPGAPSQRDLQTYAANAGQTAWALSKNVSMLETGGEARTAVDTLLASLANPLKQAQITPMKLDALIAYLDGSFPTEKNDAAAKNKDAIERLSHSGP